MKDIFKNKCGVILENSSDLRENLLNSKNITQWESAVVALASLSGFKVTFIKENLFLLR